MEQVYGNHPLSDISPLEVAEKQYCSYEIRT